MGSPGSPRRPANGRLPYSQRQQEGSGPALHESKGVVQSQGEGTVSPKTLPPHTHFSAPLPSPAPISSPVTLMVKVVGPLLSWSPGRGATLPLVRSQGQRATSASVPLKGGSLVKAAQAVLSFPHLLSKQTHFGASANKREQSPAQGTGGRASWKYLGGGVLALSPLTCSDSCPASPAN